MTDFCTRIKMIRVNLLGLNRPEFSEKFGIPEITLRSWETNRTTPTEKSLDKLISALNIGNIQVEKKWLSEGIGKPPVGIKSSIELQSLEEKSFLEENPKAIFLKLDTDSYEPTILKGSELCAIPMNKTINLSLVILDPHENSPTIMRLLLTKTGEKVLIPLSLNNKNQAMIVNDEVLLYRIISWKEETNF